MNVHSTGRIQGVVRWWNESHSCGFVSPDDGGPDCFFLLSPRRLVSMPQIRQGSRLEFTRSSAEPVPTAENVTLLSGGPQVDSHGRLRLDGREVPKDAYLFIDGLPSPTRLFKYLSPKWADAMAEHGSVLVNTTRTFRELEDDEERRDSGESTHEFLVTGTKGVEFDHNRDVPLRYRHLVSAPSGSIVLSPGARLHYVLHEPNVWVYCATEQFDEMLMRKFGGACVEITDHSTFFRHLCDALHTRSTEGDRRLFAAAVFGRCVYRERHAQQFEPGELEVHFLKPPAFRHQREVRCVWQPMPQQVVEPIPLSISELTSCCRRIH